MSNPNADPNPIILVTGANRGIGFSIIQTTAFYLPSAIYLLGSRSAQAGTEAITSLRNSGVRAALFVLELDVTSDESIVAAVERVKGEWGRLDVLVNNAAVAIPYIEGEGSSLTQLRNSFNTTLDTNVTSVATLTTAFLPLLHAAPHAEITKKIINISSARASLSKSAAGHLPPTQVLSYSVSKAALSSLTIEMARTERGRCEVYAVSPGFCRTGFNGYRGTKDPRDGAQVVLRLIAAERDEFASGGFWELEEGVMREVPW